MGVVGARGGGESGGSGGSCGSSGYSWKGSEKTQLFFLNSFSHFAIISASGIVFKKPLANFISSIKL